MKKHTYFILLLIVGASPIEVFATQDVTCAEYADRAVSQYFMMAHNGENCRLEPNARWNANRHNHWLWCTDAERSWLVSEEGARLDHLRRCGAKRVQKLSRFNECDIYARRATQQFRIMANNRNCNINPNPRWQPGYDNHYKWCLNLIQGDESWLLSEEMARDKHLRQCGGR